MKSIEVLRLHSIFLDRNRDLVLAIRDRRPREVICRLFDEIRQVYGLLRQANAHSLFGTA